MARGTTDSRAVNPRLSRTNEIPYRLQTRSERSRWALRSTTQITRGVGASLVDARDRLGQVRRAVSFYKRCTGESVAITVRIVETPHARLRSTFHRRPF